LAHAEIESFLEDRCLEAVNHAHDLWVNENRITSVLIALLAFREQSLGSIPHELDPTGPSSLRVRLWEAKNDYGLRLRHNHGIKERNVLAMLMPIGVREVDFDAIWVGEMNSFGTARGEVAHQTVTTLKNMDPLTEWQTVGRLLGGLKGIDALIGRMR
jgi:hypothetical protein